MVLYLDHTIVPAHDKEASARFIARMFGVEYHNHQGRGFYFRDANDHSWEVITHTYI